MEPVEINEERDIIRVDFGAHGAPSTVFILTVRYLIGWIASVLSKRGLAAAGLMVVRECFLIPDYQLKADGT